VSTVGDNAAPVAQADAAEVDENGEVIIDVLGNDGDTDGDPLVPIVLGQPQHGTATVLPDGTIRYVPDAGYSGPDNFSYRASDGLAQSNPVTVAITVVPGLDPLRVVEFTTMADGFRVRFDAQFDQSLIDTAVGSLGNDIVLQGDLVGVVSGLITFDPDGQGFVFTRAGGFDLQYDNYHVTLMGDDAGFKALAGLTLDGDGDDIAGGNYITTFDVIGDGVGQGELPAFMRGPGQSVDVPAWTAGLPVTFTSEGGIEVLVFSIEHDPRYLEISGATPGAGLPAGTEIRLETEVLALDRALARFTLITDTPIPSGEIDLLRLDAFVPWEATYQATQNLKAAVESINGTDKTDPATTALHVVGYFGDVDGDRTYGNGDLTTIANYVRGRFSFFPAWPGIDPLMVGDVNMNGTITTSDGSWILGESRGQDRREIPNLPVRAAVNVTGDAGDIVADPVVGGQPGETTVLHAGRAEGSNAGTVRLVLNYSASLFSLATVRKADPNSAITIDVITNVAGQVEVLVSGMVGTAAAVEQLVAFEFTVANIGAKAAVTQTAMTLNATVEAEAPEPPAPIAPLFFGASALYAPGGSRSYDENARWIPALSFDPVPGINPLPPPDETMPSWQAALLGGKTTNPNANLVIQYPK
jgi:hypothetical protein